MRSFILLSLVLLVAGCEVDNTSSGGGSTTSSGSGAVANSVDGDGQVVIPNPELDGEWESIVWLTSRGPSGKGATQVMNLSARITEDGNYVEFEWDRFPWSGTQLGHFFVWDGQVWRGGKFEGIREGGQRIKLLNNIRTGYNGHTVPAPGTPVAFAWTDQSGKQRSNLAKATWVR